MHARYDTQFASVPSPARNKVVPRHLKKHLQEERQALPIVMQRVARIRYSSKVAKLKKSRNMVNRQLKYCWWEAAMVWHLGEGVTIFGHRIDVAEWIFSLFFSLSLSLSFSVCLSVCLYVSQSLALPLCLAHSLFPSHQGRVNANVGSLLA
jgi:hypothetical protein